VGSAAKAELLSTTSDEKTPNKALTDDLMLPSRDVRGNNGSDCRMTARTAENYAASQIARSTEAENDPR
jgi:hypothetical protein